MGKDKGLLPMSGYPTLLHRQHYVLSRLNLNRILISRHSALHTPSDLCALTVKDKNTESHEGPLAGIYSACLASPDARGVLVLPVDLPNITVTELKALLVFGYESRHSARFDEDFFPLYLFLSAEIRDYLARQMALPDGDRSVRGLLECAKPNTLSVSDPKSLINTNTAVEWQSFCASNQGNLNHE